MKGNISFLENQAFSGAALYVIESFINLNEELTAYFIGNTAKTMGGALYSYTSDTVLCSIQFDFKRNFTFNGTLPKDLNIHFLNNSAIMDSLSIYAYPIYDCYQRKNSNLNIGISQLPNFYSKVFPGLSSVPKYVLLSGNSRTTGFSMYPGKDIEIQLMLVDDGNTSISR